MAKCEARKGSGCDAGEGGMRQSPTGHCPKQGAFLVQELTGGPGKSHHFPQGEGFGLWEKDTRKGENK